MLCSDEVRDARHQRKWRSGVVRSILLVGVLGGCAQMPAPAPLAPPSSAPVTQLPPGWSPSAHSAWCDVLPTGALAAMTGGTHTIEGDDARCRATTPSGVVVDWTNLSATDSGITYEISKELEAATTCDGGSLTEPTSLGPRSWLNDSCFARDQSVTLVVEHAPNVFAFAYYGAPSVPASKESIRAALLEGAAAFLSNQGGTK